MITKPLEQMTPDNYQIQHDLAMDQLERERDESSIDQMRATHHHYLEVLGQDPSYLSPNRSKKRMLSPGEESNLDKRQRMDSIVAGDSLFFPPIITSMDNLMDVIPGPMSPTRKTGRKAQELSQSPTRNKRKKGLGHLTKENQEEQDEDDEEHGQTTTAQEVTIYSIQSTFIPSFLSLGFRIGKEIKSSCKDHAQFIRTSLRFY